MGLASNHGYKSLLEQAMEVSESDGYVGVHFSMDPYDSMVPEQRHRLYFLHLSPAGSHKLYGSPYSHSQCLNILGEAADVARFCNSNVLLGLSLSDFILPADHPEVVKARNCIQAKLDAPPTPRAAAKKKAGRSPGVNKKVLQMTAAMDEDEVAGGNKRGNGWQKLHKTWWKQEFDVDWVPSPDAHAPPQYYDNVFFAGLTPRTRDIVMFLDQITPQEEGEAVFDLSDNIDRSRVWKGHCPTMTCNSKMWLRNEGRWMLNCELLAIHGFTNFNAMNMSPNEVSQAVGDSFNLFSAGAVCMGLLAAGVI